MPFNLTIERKRPDSGVREMTAEQFEDDVAMAIDKALASLTKDDVIASLELLIKVVRSGGFDPSVPPAA